MTQTLIFRIFDPKLLIIVTTDASQYAIEAVIQQVEVNVKHRVGFLSRTFNEAEQSSLTHERDLLGVTDTIGVW